MGESGGCGNEAEASQSLDPARSIALNGKRFIVGGGILVVFAPLEHEEDATQELVAHGHDSAFVAAPNEERLELGLEDRRGSAGGMGELTQKSPDIEVAFAHTSGFMFASRFVIARTDTDQGREAIRAAEGIHIGANFHQQHGRANQIDAGQGLQQGQRVTLAFQSGQQAQIEANNALLDILDMLHQFVTAQNRKL